MRSIFWKIFLWFWLAMALVSLTLVVSAIWTESRVVNERDAAMDRATTPLIADNFAEVYDIEGKAGFAELLTRDEHNFPWRPFLFDRDGNEVLGRGVSPQVRDAMRLALASKQTEIVGSGDTRSIGQYIEASSGRPYALVLEMKRSGLPSPFRESYTVQLLRVALILAIVGLICWWITRYITSPLLQLRAAANQLAQGDLSARVAGPTLRRKDELGGLSQDFNHMAGQLELLMASQRRLIADISHELRSPLARLSVALGLARRSADPSTDSSLNRIEREAQRLNELISDLLRLARLESGTEALDQEIVNLEELVASIADDAGFEAGAREGTVKVLSTFPCRRRGNAQLLRSAIENVARNAVNYTAKGTEVEISLAPADGADGARAARISIRDYGPGVPEASLQTIFEPFFRLDDARDRLSGGAGLGLSITDRVIRAHGGSVRAFNHPEGGLVIELTLPLG